MKKSKRREEYIAWLKTLSNALLWEEVLDAQSPDDYDGAFTRQGAERRGDSVNEVELRLKEWLEK